jgi:hypothetical protein
VERVARRSESVNSRQQTLRAVVSGRADGVFRRHNAARPRLSRTPNRPREENLGVHHRC